MVVRDVAVAEPITTGPQLDPHYYNHHHTSHHNKQDESDSILQQLLCRKIDTAFTKTTNTLNLYLESQTKATQDLHTTRKDCHNRLANRIFATINSLQQKISDDFLEFNQTCPILDTHDGTDDATAPHFRHSNPNTKIKSQTNTTKST